MACYHPIPGWLAKERGESGKRRIVFSADEGYRDRPAQVPCGSCIGCQLDKASSWAMRCAHEASLYSDNSFVTLTYAEAPAGGSLRPVDFTLFMKRLRKAHGKIRFFQVGEYGSELARPHHHALLFGHWFKDARRFEAAGGRKLWRSAELERLWPHGFSSIGEVNMQSAQYVARYCMKKVRGPAAEAHYRGRVPEYATMSRRPGIGRAWLEKYLEQVLRDDYIVVDGVKLRPTRYYDNMLEKSDPELFAQRKLVRKVAGLVDPDNTGRRLVVRERVKQSAIDLFLERKFENGSEDVLGPGCGV